MAALQEKFKKVYTARAKLETELSSIYSDFNNSIDKQDRKVKIERLIVKSKDAFTSVIEKNETSLILRIKLKIWTPPAKIWSNWRS